MNDELIIEAISEEETLGSSKKLLISKRNRIVWHKKLFLLKEQFKYGEIVNFEIKVDYNSERNRCRYIEANLFLITVDKKNKKVFTIDKNIRGQQELIEFEMLKEIEHLIEIISNETGKNHT